MRLLYNMKYELEKQKSRYDNALFYINLSSYHLILYWSIIIYRYINNNDCLIITFLNIILYIVFFTRYKITNPKATIL